jgi:hypothetical protein
MKYALISDVHSNLPALEAVLEDVDAIYHLGEPPTSSRTSSASGALRKRLRFRGDLADNP